VTENRKRKAAGFLYDFPKVLNAGKRKGRFANRPPTKQSCFKPEKKKMQVCRKKTGDIKRMVWQVKEKPGERSVKVRRVN